MKTPREVLLNRHASVEPRLDSLRQRAMAAVPPHTPGKTRSRDVLPLLWHARNPWSRHAVGLLAAWTVIALLRLGSEGRDAGKPLARHVATPPRSFLAQLHEHRRQIRELLPPDAKLPLPPAHSTPSLLWRRRPPAGGTIA